MKVFIPISDEMLMEGKFPDDLVCYQPGMPVFNQLQAGRTQSRSTDKRSPGATPSSDATPALSSSTYLAGPVLG